MSVVPFRVAVLVVAVELATSVKIIVAVVVIFVSAALVFPTAVVSEIE